MIKSCHEYADPGIVLRIIVCFSTSYSFDVLHTSRFEYAHVFFIPFLYKYLYECPPITRRPL